MQELVERAQIQLVLNDRLIWENGYSEGRFHSIEERKQQQCLEASWIVSHGLDTVMSRRDMQLLNQEIETVETTIRGQRSFECESIEPILWACSFVEKLTPIGKFIPFEDAVLASEDAHAPSVFEIIEEIRQTLSADEWDLLRKIALEKVPYKDAAAELGITIWTYQKRVQRIREKLRENFKDNFY